MIKDLPFTDFKTKSDYFVLKLEECFLKGKKYFKGHK